MNGFLVLVVLIQLASLNASPITLWNQTDIDVNIDIDKFSLKEGDMVLPKVLLKITNKIIRNYFIETKLLIEKHQIFRIKSQKK
jgi:hypothetical protein